jgi:hypothetical protein
MRLQQRILINWTLNPKPYKNSGASPLQQALGYNGAKLSRERRDVDKRKLYEAS